MPLRARLITMNPEITEVPHVTTNLRRPTQNMNHTPTYVRYVHSA